MASDNNNATNSIERVYAQALLELSEAAGQIDAIRDEMLEVGQLIANQPELAKLLDSKILRSESLASAIKAIFEGKVSDVVYRFLQVLNNKGRIDQLPGVIRAYEQLVEAKHGIVKVDAYVATNLDQAQADKVASGIGKALGKTVVLQQHLDPSLIGGLKLRVGDKLIDGSAVAQLKIMKDRIIKEGRAKARATRESA